MNRLISVATFTIALCLLVRISVAQPQPAQASSMLDMTFPEFEAAVSKTDVVLLPLGSIEEHGTYLPLQSDAITSLGLLNDVQRSLRARRIETIVGPPLNIGLTAETGDFMRSGTYLYPGSLTVRVDTFVALYLDVLRSLHDNGLRHAFLFSGHGATSQGVAMARIAREASRTIPGMTAYAMVPSESIERFGLAPEPSLLPLQDFRNFPLLTKLLGSGSEPPRTTHADGAETSLMLFYRPDMVRSGYRNAPIGTSTAFFAASQSGNRADNPTGTGGFPSDKASAAVGKQLLDHRTAVLSNVIARTLATKPSK